MELNLDNLKTGEPAPLHLQYDGQHKAEVACVEMDEDGGVYASGGFSRNSSSPDVYHGKTLQWEVPAQVNGEALADLIESEEVQDLLGRVEAGHSVDWNGNNYVGKLNDDAQSASDQLDTIFADVLADEVLGSAGDYLQHLSFDQLWKKDQTLNEAVGEIESDARDNVGGLVKIDADFDDYLLRSAAEFVSDEEPGLFQNHLDALIKAGKIDVDEAAEYAAEHFESIVLNGNGYTLNEIAEFVSDDEPGLSQNNLVALIEAGKINADEAAEYASEHIKSSALTM